MNIIVPADRGAREANRIMRDRERMYLLKRIVEQNERIITLLEVLVERLGVERPE
jgi:hypothetical protein